MGFGWGSCSLFFAFYWWEGAASWFKSNYTGSGWNLGLLARGLVLLSYTKLRSLSALWSPALATDVATWKLMKAQARRAFLISPFSVCKSPFHDFLSPNPLRVVSVAYSSSDCKNGSACTKLKTVPLTIHSFILVLPSGASQIIYFPFNSNTTIIWRQLWHLL